MSTHIEVTASEAADRLAIREPFDPYAHCAERRDAEGHGREVLTPIFADLNRCEMTAHFNGQSLASAGAS